MRPTRREARFWVRLSESEKRGLMRVAIERDVTASQLVRHAIRQVLTAKGENKR